MYHTIPYPVEEGIRRRMGHGRSYGGDTWLCTRCCYTWCIKPGDMVAYTWCITPGGIHLVDHHGAPIRARWGSKNLYFLLAHTFIYVFFKVRRGSFSWIFVLEDSFTSKIAIFLYYSTLKIMKLCFFSFVIIARTQITCPRREMNKNTVGYIEINQWDPVWYLLAPHLGSTGLQTALIWTKTAYLGPCPPRRNQVVWS